MANIAQGDQYALLIHGEGFDIADVAEVEFCIGNLRKMYPETVLYDEEHENFIFPLTQAETFAFCKAVRGQARVHFLNGDVRNGEIGLINVRESISKVVL